MSAKSDPRYGKAQPTWLQRIVFAVITLTAAVGVAAELIW